MTNIDEYEDKAEGWVYMFGIFQTEQGRFIAECNEDLILPAWLNAFIDQNEERLRDLWERTAATWRNRTFPPYIQCFWEEDDNDVLCKFGRCAAEFEEHLPRPRGIKFKNKDAHKKMGLDVEE